VSTTENDCLAWGQQQLQRINVTEYFAATLIKQRAWSTVWKLESPTGRYYLKAAAPGFDVEAPLLATLCRWQPASIVELIAADITRGWMLTRDAGRMLHDTMFDDQLAGRAQLRSILLTYAGLQVACQQHGAPAFKNMLEDRSPLAMSKSFTASVANDAILSTGGATPEELHQRSRWLERADDLCRELASLNLPLTLEHGDLHTSNIMIASNGTPRIADWGDACWTTPLHGLAMCLYDVAGRHKIQHDDPWFEQLIEDHVSAWRNAGSTCDFRRALEIVRALAPVSGVLQWSRGIDRMPADARKLMAAHIVKHLRAFV
jgi:Phosphotransferase enzyme family